ncbi:ABC transporter permease [Actinomadura formosensis]|uniref:ABC transporter permease n=1 Tax=Actinomadura formosensis TaxID=60706 RepID=UPI00082B68EF|nr:ABC transporter permease [Actinomadura formosensis]
MHDVQSVPLGGRASLLRRLKAIGHPRFLGLQLLVVLTVFFSAIYNITFFSADNYRAIASNESVGIILAMALLVSLVIGHYDLSIASVLTLSMITVTGLLQEFQLNLWTACLAGVATGLLVGVVNGIAVAVFRVSSLVATLATGSIALGIAQWWTNGRLFTEHIPSSFTDLGNSELFGVPVIFVLALVIAAAVWWVLEQTPLGRYLYALGDNPSAADLAGLPTRALTIGTMAAGGALAGFAGVVETAKLGAGNPTIGTAFLLPAFTAVFLGATIIRIGVPNVVGTIIAVLLMAVLVAGLNQSGLPFYVEPLLKGAVLLFAVAITLKGHGGRAR